MGMKMPRTLCQLARLGVKYCEHSLFTILHSRFLKWEPLATLNEVENFNPQLQQLLGDRQRDTHTIGTVTLACTWTHARINAPHIYSLTSSFNNNTNGLTSTSTIDCCH